MMNHVAGNDHIKTRIFKGGRQSIDFQVDPVMLLDIREHQIRIGNELPYKSRARPQFDGLFFPSRKGSIQV